VTKPPTLAQRFGEDAVAVSIFRWEVRKEIAFLPRPRGDSKAGFAISSTLMFHPRSHFLANAAFVQEAQHICGHMHLPVADCARRFYPQAFESTGRCAPYTN